ncbi:MAG: glycosyltransferase family 39 protein [Candidatus Aenigmatarchaeota archaeon]
MRSKSNLIVFLLSISFLIFYTLNLTPVFSDETIYINMAKSIANGLLPYKNFFYAHPPFQLFILTPMATTNNFVLVKIFIALIGLISILLTYLIAKEIFNEKIAITAFVFFLIFPGFLIFGTQAMGMFEALLFFLISFYLILKKKLTFSALFFVVSFFTRYLAILLFPLLIFYIYKNFKKKEFFRFIGFVFLFSTIAFVLLISVFGVSYVNYTISYHLSANLKSEIGIANWVDQYLVIGYFTIFLSFFALTYGYIKKVFLIILFSLYPLIYDLLILLLLKQAIYHYFILPLPLLFISISATFWRSKFYSLMFFIVAVISLSIYTNLANISLYYNREKNKVFQELIDYTLNNTNEKDLIFGEPRSLNYVSFVTNRKIVNNYFDSDLKFINFVGKEKVLNEVKKAKPKLIFANQFYLDFFKEDYEIVKEWNEPGYYHMFLMKLKE